MTTSGINKEDVVNDYIKTTNLTEKFSNFINLRNLSNPSNLSILDEEDLTFFNLLDKL